MVAQVKTPLGSPQGGVESLDHLSCALQHRIQGPLLALKRREPAGLLDFGSLWRLQRTICVWVTKATSFPSSVSSRVCQTCVRRPRCTGVAVAITVLPSFAPPMKLVLLSIVVVPLASSGRLIRVAAAPTESASAMIAPP